MKPNEIHLMQLSWLLPGLFIFLAIGGVSAQQYIFPVVPSTHENVEGNTDAFPFIGDPFSARFQQVYDSSAFVTEIPAGGAWISEVIFRVDGPRGNSFESIQPNVQVNLSVTSRSPDGLSPIIDENVGANNTVVTGPGPVVLSGAWSAPENWPNGFATGFHFNTPYFYDPAQGNLLLDLRVMGGAALSPLDATDVAGDPVSSVFAYGRTLPTTGTPSSAGIVTMFVVIPIPEPSSLTLLGIGFAAVGWFFAWRKKGAQ